MIHLGGRETGGVGGAHAFEGRAEGAKAKKMAAAPRFYRAPRRVRGALWPGGGSKGRSMLREAGWVRFCGRGVAHARQVRPSALKGVKSRQMAQAGLFAAPHAALEALGPGRCARGARNAVSMACEYRTRNRQLLDAWVTHALCRGAFQSAFRGAVADVPRRVRCGDAAHAAASQPVSCHSRSKRASPAAGQREGALEPYRAGRGAHLNGSTGFSDVSGLVLPKGYVGWAMGRFHSLTFQGCQDVEARVHPEGPHLTSWRSVRPGSWPTG